MKSKKMEIVFDRTGTEIDFFEILQNARKAIGVIEDAVILFGFEQSFFDDYIQKEVDPSNKHKYYSSSYNGYETLLVSFLSPIEREVFLIVLERLNKKMKYSIIVIANSE